MLLTNVSGLTYSTVGQTRKIYVANNTPFNQFKFENFGSGNPSSCTWRILSLDLIAENVLADVPDFTYESSITICKHTEISEVIPENGDHFMNFRINHSLLAGIVLDRYSGWISGTALDMSTATIHTISCYQGDVTSTTLLKLS